MKFSIFVMLMALFMSTAAHAATQIYEVQDSENPDIVGTCEMDDKAGECTIVNADGDEVSAQAEWIGHGVLEATDDDGEIYQMEVQ